MLFEKTSTRTRISFESGFSLLGGHPIYLEKSKTNISLSELKDEIRYITRNVDIIMARMINNDDLKVIMENTNVPVINGCCNLFHPCQVLADLLTMSEFTSNNMQDIVVTYVGKLNNVSRELIYAATKLGFKLNFMSPDDVTEESLFIKINDKDIFGNLTIINDINQFPDVIAESQFVYTDTWIDMEYYNNPKYKLENEKTKNEMMKYQLNNKVFSYNPNVMVMHDMPMHVGYEITRDVIENKNAIIFQQAENRMWVQNVLMMKLLGLSNNFIC